MEIDGIKWKIPPNLLYCSRQTWTDVNLMNRKTFNQLFGEAKEVLQLTPIRMENYGNTAVKVLGMFHAFLRWKQDILDVYSDVFTGIGKFPGMSYKFQLKPNAKPARHAPRKVPIHLQDAFHKEIRNLEQLGILEETKDVTEWVNSFVIMEKKVPTDSSKFPTDSNSSQGHSMNKKLRICLDPRDLNEALEREPYYTWSIEEIMGKCHGMTRFTIADFNKGYWMVELDPESRKYTMMALDIGGFQWT